MAVWCSRVSGDERHAAHALLLERAAQVLGRSAGELHLVHEPGGRPRLAGDPTGGAVGLPARLHVAVSHGRGVVAVALSLAGPVGVDVEVVRPLPAVALARRWFPIDEADWVAGHSPADRTRAFLALWTAKEAVGKALGTGLRGGGLHRRVPPPVELGRGDHMLAVAVVGAAAAVRVAVHIGV